MLSRQNGSTLWRFPSIGRRKAVRVFSDALHLGCSQLYLSIRQCLLNFSLAVEHRCISREINFRSTDICLLKVMRYCKIIADAHLTFLEKDMLSMVAMDMVDILSSLYT